MGRIAPRLLAAAMTIAALLGVDAGVASATASAPYFNGATASGTPELQTPRAGAVAATLPDGQVLGSVAATERHVHRASGVR